MPGRWPKWIILGLIALLGDRSWAQLNGALAAGGSAEALASGGAVVASTGSVLNAVEVNPAGLAEVKRPTLEVSGLAGLAEGQFANGVDAAGYLEGNAGALGYGAVAVPLGAWRAAFGVTPEDLIRVNWRYVDPPGTAGASYGLQMNRSEILALRSSATLARSFGEHWAVGVTAGLMYNANTLQAPFVFQQQAALRGLKVLLNLHTAGFGWNGAAGAQWALNRRARFGVSWKSSTAVQSHGTASGTASAQFAALGLAANPEFRYGAEVDTRLPESVSVGADIEARRRTRVLVEGDWTGWAGAFRSLPVKLKGGTNATINTVTGSNAIQDLVPLGWRNQGGLRIGGERLAGERWAVRGGYGFQSDPVPSGTLTPLTAAVLRQSLAGGAGLRKERWRLDASYQVQLPASRFVGQSALLAGEYSNSRVRVWTQEVTITGRIVF